MKEAYFDCLIEEAAELIKATTKAKRFGLDDSHPDYEGGASNRLVILAEIGDVLALIEKTVSPGPEQDLVDQARRSKLEKLKVYGPHGTYLASDSVTRKETP